jgi:putative hydrolase of the HAD superfamily
MLHGRRLRCILFDLGNTLWARLENSDAHDLARERAGHLLREISEQPVLPALDERSLGASLEKAIYQQMYAVERQRPGYEPDYTLVTQEAVRQFCQCAIASADASALFEELRVRIPISRALFADAFSTLEALKQRGYLLGIVTNRRYGGALFREDVEVMGLLDYFEYAHMAISADLRICKPHPDIFHYALRALGAAPLEAAMVGDSLRDDIAGANALQIFSIWKNTALGTRPKKARSATIVPDVEIDELGELLNIF